MRYLLTLLVTLVAIQLTVAPPVTQNKKDTDKDKENEVDGKDDPAGITEYHRYLKEVVQVLESDPDFLAKLEKANEDDIRTGRIARELKFVDRKIRTRLDELKRDELKRLRDLATRENQLINGLDIEHLKIAEHIDHTNNHTFEINDLKKLIAKTTKDLAEADERRHKEFKEYEMQKKYEEEEKMKGNTGMNEEERKKYEQELHALKEKHKKHEPLHHPGSKQQLEEVWEKQDHMNSQDFDPKTFFYLHDIDGNQVWDQDEVKVLFLKELDKLYEEGAPEDDLFERAEEMERMREHVFQEADINKDGVISYEEFLEQTKKPSFQVDEGWEGLDAEQVYSQQEYEAYLKRRQEEGIQNTISKGMQSSHSDNIAAQQQHQQQFPPQYANAPIHQAVPAQDFVPGMAGRVPDQVPHHQQQFQGQQPPPPPPPLQASQHPTQHGQVPPQHYQNQVYSQQQLPGQVPPQGSQYGHVPQQQYQAQNALPPVQQQQQQQQQQHHQQQQYQVPVQQYNAQHDIVQPVIQGGAPPHQNNRNQAQQGQLQNQQIPQPQAHQQIQHNVVPSVAKV